MAVRPHEAAQAASRLGASVPGFEVEQWQAIYVPAHTPKPIVQRLNVEIGRILKDPEVVAKFEGLGVTPVGGTPEQLANVQKADTAVAATASRGWR